MTAEPESGLASRAADDFRRGAAVALLGCAAVAAVEYVATLVAAPGHVFARTALRFALLDVSLIALFALLAVPLTGALAAAPRLLYGLVRPAAARAWAGPLTPRGLPAGALSAAPAWLWGLLVGALLYLGASSSLTYYFTTHRNAPDVVALVLAGLQLGLALICGFLGWLAYQGARRLGVQLQPLLGAGNPFGRTGPAVLAVLGLKTAGVLLLLGYLPKLRPLVPHRHVLAAAAFAAGGYAGLLVLARRGSLLPRARGRRRAAIAGLAAGFFAIVPATLIWVGADPDTKYLAITASPPLSSLIDAVRSANDFDRDGFGSLLGERDCAPFDRAIHRGARDLPDNGIDENCDGQDFSRANLPTYRKGERMAVPAAFLREWNVLLITVDTVRYDHTGFGGYAERTGRATTPNLDKLCARATCFDFANAPSAGTMASVPAIVTSKFFHSGIALSGERRPKPPKVLEANLLIGEVMKRGGYATGAVLSHEYFNDWGLDQGIDDYDNEIGAKRNEFAITSQDITDKAVAWIAQHSDRRWFLWAHYIDPHGRYVAHPGGPSFGKSEEDLYDGELAYTDQHLGRLLGELQRIPGGDRTIVIVTSDHGDAFGEHGFINHAIALYRELLHVPLIVYVPDAEPRRVAGAVTPLDILPTVADLCGIDVSDATFEGESLVPQIFYGRDATDRVVFAETNAPHPQRAAITSRYKLIYNLKADVYELFDLVKDPLEKKNVWTRDREGADRMRAYMDDWLERVYYARDPEHSQAAAKRAENLLAKAPAPAQPTAHRFDDGAIEVLGFDLDKRAYRPGDKVRLTLYLKAARRPSDDFRLQIELWPEEAVAPAAPSGGGPAVARSPSRLTGDGIFPSSRWREGEYIKDELVVTRVPLGWRPGRIHVGLRLTGEGKKEIAFTGPARPGDPRTARLGELTLEAGPPPPPGLPAPPRPAPTQPPKRRGTP